jgi:hypothetical protein
MSKYRNVCHLCVGDTPMCQFRLLNPDSEAFRECRRLGLLPSCGQQNFRDAAMVAAILEAHEERSNVRVVAGQCPAYTRRDQ